MADVKEIKQYQRKKKRRYGFWRTLILSTIAIGVFLFVAFSEGWINKDLFAQLVNKPQGYPVAVIGGKPKSIIKSKKNIVLLTDTDLVYYNEHGTVLSQTVHNCVNPYIITKNNSLLVYDKGYSFFQIQDKNGILYSNSISNRLTNADLADNGSYAISTTSTRYLSEMFVYNKNNSEICHWKSVESYISSMSFSKTSKKIAVASIYAESGYFNSNIRIFDLNRVEDPVILNLNFNDSAIVKIQYLNSGKILVIFDNYYVLETLLTAPAPSVNKFNENGNPVYAKETRSKKDIKCFQRAQEGILEYFDTYLRLCPKAEQKENKKLDEDFLKLIHGIAIADKDTGIQNCIHWVFFLILSLSSICFS